MSDLVKFGVISCSNMARGHMKGIVNNAHAKLVAICDIDEEKMKAAGEAYNVPEEGRYTDYHQLLAREDVEAVVIVTPDRLHREMAVAALEAGKHVLCEKPLALTREDIKAIADATKKTDKKFMIGQICRFTPAFQKAKEMIEKGEIGELKFIESEYAHDYEKILNPSTWRYDPLRNGVVGGGCHAVDLLRWIAGRDPEEVTAYSTSIRNDLPYDDTHIGIMKFPGGLIGKVFVSISCRRAYTMRSVFYGTTGTIVCDNKSPYMTVFRKYHNGSDTDLFFSDKAMNQEIEVKYPISVANHNATGEISEFVKCIVEDLPIKTTVYEGAKSVATCFAIVDSASQGKPIVPDFDF